MLAASEVTPHNWSEITVVYDDGNYSAIWGRYLDRNYKEVGVRWNGGPGEEFGFPSQGRNPTWYVEPPFMSEAVLLGLLEALLTSNTGPNHQQHVENILFAIREAKQQARAV
jgi:hypothetical protein